jgi:nucleotide-binding universal stress UspA family protein
MDGTTTSDAVGGGRWKEKPVGTRIVVGIDGSIDGQRALAWAVDEAARRTAELVVVHAWEYPPATFVFPPSPKETAAEILAKSVEGLDTQGVDIRTRLVEGRPITVLVKEARDADMLVVGSRGHSGVASVVLGSVSTGCIHHAACPVVVVPPPRSVSVTPEPAGAVT